MAFKSQFYQFIWAILIMQSFGQERRTDESIFEDDFCDVKCGENVTHTMCPIKDLKAECNDFELHRFDLEKYAELLKLLIHGHNGVRNRIAERMHVPNMLEMTWDRKLALMAENYLHRCNDRITDPCTLQSKIFKEKDTINEFFKFNASDSYIVQNTFYEKSHFYPFNFLERVIRSWYFEKDGMRAPSLVENVNSNLPIKRILGENNFTHFAYPFIYRFGCGMASYKGGFYVICNYYPFYRTLSNTMYFQTGPPTTDCPARFPLIDEMFNNLCTDESDNYFKTEKNNEDAAHLIRYNIFLLLCSEFSVLYWFGFYI